MKSLITVLTEVAHDVGDVCGVSTVRDVKTITDRTEEEGLSFLTITLPTFTKSLEQALSRGYVTTSDFPGFRRDATGLPRFCGGFLRLIFGPCCALLDVPDVDAIRAIRQICSLFSKLEGECSEKRVRDAYTKYIECENDIKSYDLPDTSDLEVVFSQLFGNLMSALSTQVDDCTLIPRHGPGATADRLKGNQKWRQREWPSRLEKSFPMDAYLLPNHRDWRILSRVDVVEPGNERPVKVIHVPKTMKTPRIIAVEPTCMMYAQQALLRGILEEIQRDTTLSSLVGLDDQVPNRDLARAGSSSGLTATLDLSEASDRVSNELVYRLTRPYGSFRKALQDSRSKRARVPGYGIIRLHKYASMGSATCFPVEGMVFAAISTLGVLRKQGHTLSYQSVRAAATQVRVFGDDIIVPTDCAEMVVDLLTLYGLKVNREKSFWTGKFRESCGGDYYDGEDVSIHRFRRVLPSTIRDARGVASLFSFRNQAYQSGYWKTVRLIDTHLESIRAPLPRVLQTSPVLGRLSFLGYESQGFDKNLHTPVVRGLQIVSRPPVSKLRDEYALLKIFATKRTEPLGEGHLERLGRPDRVHTKIRWATPY